MKSALPVTHSSIAKPTAQRARVLARPFSIGSTLTMAGLLALALAVATDRFGIRLQNLTWKPGYDTINLRLELIVGVLLAGVCLAVWRLRVLRFVGPVEWLLLGWLGVNAVASAISSPAPAHSLQFTLLIAAVLALYWAARILMRSSDGVTWAAVAWMGAGSVVMLLGLAAALLYTFFGWTPGVSFNRTYQEGILTLTPMVYSTMWEANIFGSYSLTVGSIAFGLSRAPMFQGRRAQWLLRLAVACALCGTVLSMTRTAWAAGLVVVAALCVVALRRRLAGWRQLASALIVPALVGVVVGLVVGYAMPRVSWATDAPWSLNYEQAVKVASDVVRSRNGVPTVTTQGSNPAPFETDSAVSERARELNDLGAVPTWVIRQNVLAKAFQGWLERPLFGWGAGAYQFVYPPDPGENYWISNLELYVLFETGLVGLALLSAAVGVAVWRGVRALRQPITGWGTAQFALVGVMFALLALFLTYQVTQGMWLGFTWLLFAMLVSGGETRNVMRDA